jgi:hypothetical protein
MFLNRHHKTSLEYFVHNPQKQQSTCNFVVVVVVVVFVTPLIIIMSTSRPAALAAVAMTTAALTTTAAAVFFFPYPSALAYVADHAQYLAAVVLVLYVHAYVVVGDPSSLMECSTSSVARSHQAGSPPRLLLHSEGRRSSNSIKNNIVQRPIASASTSTSSTDSNSNFDSSKNDQATIITAERPAMLTKTHSLRTLKLNQYQRAKRESWQVLKRPARE